MRKLFLLCVAFLLSTAIFAQTTKEKSVMDPAKVEANKKKEASKSVFSKTKAAKEKQEKEASAVKLKKDGTPDKRFKKIGRAHV